MKLKFTSSAPLQDTMVFESIYEEGLQLDLEERKADLADAVAVYLWVDGELAGETYSRLSKNLDEPDMPDYMNFPDAQYVCSTTILPKFQGKGLGKLLKAYHLGVLRGMGVETVIGHSTSPEMKRINEQFGAIHTASHENWYDSGRTAYFYRMNP